MQMAVLRSARKASGAGRAWVATATLRAAEGFACRRDLSGRFFALVSLLSVVSHQSGAEAATGSLVFED
jgi:hypothetical protein